MKLETMKEWLLFLLFLFGLSAPSLAGDNITVGTSIGDGQTIISAGGNFELGFFTPGASQNKYLGIWYKKIPVQTVVWVANRENPVTDSTGNLIIGNNGDLVLQNRAGTVLWSIASLNLTSPVAQLLDSGNFVLKDLINGSESIVWQSFDYPSDTLLSGMKLGWDSVTNLNRYLTSWKSPLDPSPGPYSHKLDLTGLPEVFTRNGSSPRSRSGPWNGHGYGGLPLMISNSYFTFRLVANSYERYYQFETINMDITSVVVLDSEGVTKRIVWLGHQWSPYWSFPSDLCDNYAACGTNGVCRIDGTLVCECLTGFEPRFAEEWALRDWSGGCSRKVELDCGKVLETSDGFVNLTGLKLPDASNATVNGILDFDGCRDWCLKDCSCKAFAMSGGSECAIWRQDLVDIREFANRGENLYVRLAASELGSVKGRSKKKQLMIIMILVFGILFIALGGLLLWKKKKRQGIISDLLVEEVSGHELELTLFDRGTIKSATDSFSIKNILGEGGFGLVYKGRLRDGQDIAVKMLSNDSVQGLDEFKNEVMLISKLQHRNLVRLLGSCIHEEERMLIYEYMPNKSLDTLIFDKEKGALLDWQKRIDIIVGIARGLLYLHQDSRFNIIHRDLKASNILLDKEMNPKISDFGTARIFRADKMQESTKRVVGTYGYMSPEYAMDGIYSVKSDVFSFGVIVLEILSGKKNRVVYEAEAHMNLLENAWRLWMEDKSLELLDESLECPCPKSELLRCIQVGLLCVQEGRDDRPTMSSVVLMLSSKNVELPQPKRPGFCMRTVMGNTPTYADATNEVTITMLEGR